MSFNTETSNQRIGGWRKLSQWIRAFDESLDFDPIEYTLAQANRNVSQLETRVQELENRLTAQSSHR